jgi:hypothetical protein
MLLGGCRFFSNSRFDPRALEVIVRYSSFFRLRREEETIANNLATKTNRQYILENVYGSRL